MIEKSGYFPIGALERDTGIGRDTLRVWERRYGFPQPIRNDRGERIYPETQVRRLQRIRRLLDQGLRPGKLLPLSESELDRLEHKLQADSTAADVANEQIALLIGTLQTSNTQLLESMLDQQCRELGLERFVLQVMAPLVDEVGKQWARNRLTVYQEHLLTQQLTRVLNHYLHHDRVEVQSPTVLLTTLPGEQHGLGLLMVHALLYSHGIECIQLGCEMPMDQVVAAVHGFGVDTVGLTFSSAYPYHSIRPHLRELCQRLPQETRVWIGGDGVSKLRKLPANVTKFVSLEPLVSLKQS